MGEATASAAMTWAGFTWPEWVPAEQRKHIEDFWDEKCGDRGPAGWIANAVAPYNGGAPLGTWVVADHVGGRGRVFGRYVHAWNNIGNVVRPDGTVVCVSGVRPGPVPGGNTKSFSDGKPRVATHEDVNVYLWAGTKPGPSSAFRCGFCGHRFAVGDYWRWVYTNDLPGAGGNPFACASCDDEPEKARANWAALHAEWKALRQGRFWWFARNMTPEASDGR